MMIILFLLAFASISNASFLKLFGGSSAGSSATSSNGVSSVNYDVVATPFAAGQENGHGSYAQSYDGVAAPQIYKIILEHGEGDALDGGSIRGHASSGYFSPFGGDASFSSATADGGAQIFKVITENRGSFHGYSSDHSIAQGKLYASGYSHNSGIGLGGDSQINNILPQIIQLVLQEEGGFGDSGGNDYNAQLIAHFGQKGKAVITRSYGKSKSNYKGGHVVQKGVLKVMRVEQGQATEGGAYHAPSPHGPPLPPHRSRSYDSLLHAPQFQGPPRGHGW